MDVAAPRPLTKQAPNLLDRMRSEIRVRHFSYRTEQTYVQWVKRFILFHHKRNPTAMSAQELGAYLSHLAEQRQVSASTQNQALNALVFLYRQVLKMNWMNQRGQESLFVPNNDS